MFCGGFSRLPRFPRAGEFQFPAEVARSAVRVGEEQQEVDSQQRQQPQVQPAVAKQPELHHVPRSAGGGGGVLKSWFELRPSPSHSCHSAKAINNSNLFSFLVRISPCGK